MGMPVSLAVRPPTGSPFADVPIEEGWQQALAVLHEADRVFSTYRPDSAVSRLGRGELTLEECPPEVAEVLELGEIARRESGGAFDVRRSHGGRPPVLDPSGVVKGWAVARAARAFKQVVDADFCLSAGGDMVCRTYEPSSPPWRIGVEDPHDPTRVVAVVPIRNGALATSGTAHRGAHVVDARTGQVPTSVASVTVVAADLVWADIDATAAFALDEEAADWLASRPGKRGIVVWADGSLQLVEG
jgi:thiamine biosynthesis lipoprotein